MILPGSVYVCAPRPPGHYRDGVVVGQCREKLAGGKTHIFHADTCSLDVFLAAVLLRLKIVVYVDNYDRFFHKFRHFKHLNFVYLGHTEAQSGARERYAEVERSMRSSQSAEKENRTGFDLLNKIDADMQSQTKGIDVSFAPRIFESIHSSLLRPELYLYHEDDASSRLYARILSGKQTLEQLRAFLGKDPTAELKSLVFSSAIEFRDGHFHPRLTS